MLATENNKRNNEIRDDKYDTVLVRNEDGTGTRVDKAFLDLTDKQNRDFRYVL